MPHERSWPDGKAAIFSVWVLAGLLGQGCVGPFELDNRCDPLSSARCRLDDGTMQECGPDPCGVSCGTCLNGAQCVDNARCVCPGSVELCNRLDDDCDGLTDEEVPVNATECGAGPCASNGVTTCVAGIPGDTCVPGTSKGDDKDCNGVDDDCNGKVDDRFVIHASKCGIGACERTGEIRCVGGGLVDTCLPGAPSSDADCDGVDDDCDGQADDDYQPTETTCGIGACASHGMLLCVAGLPIDDCQEGEPSGNDVDCDGGDNDCGGETDEGYIPHATSCGQGVCASEGQALCIEGEVVDTCAKGSATGDDSDCDGKDDDCDGDTDEAYLPIPFKCGTGACAVTVYSLCAGGTEQNPDCVPGQPAVSDATCDGVDDDCDGETDEEYQPHSTSCGEGPCASTGNSACVDGKEEDTCQPLPPDCTGKECGSDGCGGTCGGCDPSDPCKHASCIDGHCEYEVLPDCCVVDTDCPDYQLCAWRSGGTGKCESACVSSCPPGLGYQRYLTCNCRVMPTNVTACSNGSAFVTCNAIVEGSPYYGQDGNYAKKGTLQLVDDGNGATVTDLLTDWTWALTETAYNHATTNSWAEASQACASNTGDLPGEGWVLPNPIALQGVLDYSKDTCPAAATVFSLPCKSYWTGAAAGAGAYTANLDASGGMIAIDGTSSVVNGAWCARPLPGDAVVDRFVEKQGGGFHDRVTGIEWELSPSSMSSAWVDALALCIAKGPHWRLPDAKEILSLVDYESGTRGEKCMWYQDLAEILGTDCAVQSRFWSATPWAGDAGSAFVADFRNGTLGIHTMTQTRGAWCVKSFL